MHLTGAVVGGAFVLALAWRSLAGTLMHMTASMRERIRTLRQRLLEHCSRYDDLMLRDTRPRAATYSFLRRARSLDRAIWLLLENEGIPEAAILLRSQINLLWCFLFMVDARPRDGKFEFDHAPPAGSTSDRRAARFLSWHWVDLHRRNPSPRSEERFNRFVREHGYSSKSDVPRYWYQEDRIHQIKDLATAVGGLRQYEEDYTHLSGVEHNDVTASIVQDLCGERYGDFIAFKSTQLVSAIMDFAVKIYGCTLTTEWVRMMEEFNALADKVDTVARQRETSGD